jgi:hypothetical protein
MNHNTLVPGTQQMRIIYDVLKFNSVFFVKRKICSTQI